MCPWEGSPTPSYPHAASCGHAIDLRCTAGTGRRPTRRRRSRRVHSTHTPRIADLPIAGCVVTLHLLCREFSSHLPRLGHPRPARQGTTLSRPMASKTQTSWYVRTKPTAHHRLGLLGTKHEQHIGTDETAPWQFRINCPRKVTISTGGGASVASELDPKESALSGANWPGGRLHRTVVRRMTRQVVRLHRSAERRPP